MCGREADSLLNELIVFAKKKVIKWLGKSDRCVLGQSFSRYVRGCV